MPVNGKAQARQVAEAIKTRWPQPGDPYYFITSALTVDVTDFGGRRLNHLHQESCNMFKSSETAAQFASKMRKFLAEHNPMEP